MASEASETEMRQQFPFIDNLNHIARIVDKIGEHDAVNKKRESINTSPSPTDGYSVQVILGEDDNASSVFISKNTEPIDGSLKPGSEASVWLDEQGRITLSINIDTNHNYMEIEKPNSIKGGIGGTRELKDSIIFTGHYSQFGPKGQEFLNSFTADALDQVRKSG